MLKCTGWPLYNINNSLCAPFLECLLEFPCQWNYRPDHCIYGSNCMSAEEEGIYILHGNRGVYHDHKQPAFRAVYEAIQKVGNALCYCKTRCLVAFLPSSTHNRSMIWNVKLGCAT